MTFSQFLTSIKERKSLLDVLENLGEHALSESFEKVRAASGSLIGPVFVHDGKYPRWGALFCFGLNELPDGTVTDDFSHPWNTPKEYVMSEEDIVPAARRFLQKILSGSRRFRMRLELMGVKP
jgi:hypothetical protein